MYYVSVYAKLWCDTNIFSVLELNSILVYSEWCFVCVNISCPKEMSH